MLGLPAASRARTEKVCWPSASAAVVSGLAQSANAALSRLHSSAADASPSEKAKLGCGLLLGSAGFVSMLGAGGGAVSTVQVAEVALLTVPSRLRARTEKLC